jgi:hypothetical protein
MRTCFFTISDDRYYYPVGTPILINSFKKFHPDIDLIVFRQDMIDKVFREKNINFYKAKPVFAKLLTDKYDLVVNIDADSIVLDRLDKILEGDFDVAVPSNFNDYENMSIANVTEEMFIQAGLVASTNKRFWDIWEEANVDAMKYQAQENTVLNLLWYNHPELQKMNKVILDKDKDYYGCKSLNREKEFYVKDNKIWCRDEQVFIYHWAKGGSALPKMRFEQLRCEQEVVEHLYKIGYEGVSICISHIQ